MAYSASDYARVPKSDPKYNQRWYVNKETGKRISRWDYQTLKADGMTPRAKAKVRRTMRVANHTQSHINAIVHKYKKHKAIELGIKPSQVKVRGQSADAVLFRERVRRMGKINKNGKASKAADGELANLLVLLGFRKREWDMPVGESPREKG